MSFQDQDVIPQIETEDIKPSKRFGPSSYETGGLARSDTPIPENQNDDPRYITTTEYLEKYSHFLPNHLNIRDLRTACQKWHENETLPENQRIGLISEKRLVPDTAGINKNGTIIRYINRKRWQWFIFDIPPQDHHGWNAYQSWMLNNLRKSGKAIAGKFKKLAPIYLERFDNARKELDHTQFRISELANMLQTDKTIIKSWVTIGVDGYGKLPHIKASDTIKPLKTEDGKYSCEERVQAGRIDYYFSTKDIRRFLKGELADPTKKFKTIDDATEHTNATELAAESGYFVWDRNKSAPLTYEGFMKWCKENIVMYDRHTRRIMQFKPCPKQIEFYKKVFTLRNDGFLQYNFIFACRPRGEYKTFDLAIIALFRFLNFEERIYLITNSVQQTTHLVYREAVNIIKKSPNLSAMLNTPALDIQESKGGIYLRSGRGIENIFSSMEIVSAEGGARSNATCMVWSEAWKFKGNESDVSEIMDSIRGIDNAFFLAESTVAPKGHWFQRHYEISLEGTDPILYFQYYDDTQRQNPKITDEFINLKKKVMPLQWKMFFGNRWEDAAIGLFTEPRIIEMGYLGINGGISRNNEMLDVIDEIVKLNAEIKKYESGIDVSRLKYQHDELLKLLTPFDYSFPLTPENLKKLSLLYDCDFIIGIGLDRAKQFRERSDRTVLSTIARAIFSEEKAKIWGTDRIFFLLNLRIGEELIQDTIMKAIQEDIDNYGGGFGYIDLEDYNVIDIYKSCEKLYGKDTVMIAPNSLKHQTQIFTEICLASRSGYLKIPIIDIWTDEQDVVHFTKPPIGKQDIIRTEMAIFESREGHMKGGRGSQGWFGSPFKILTGHTTIGMPKDDTVYSIAHAINASIRGDIPAVMRNIIFASAIINEDVIGDYRD